VRSTVYAQCPDSFRQAAFPPTADHYALRQCQEPKYLPPNFGLYLCNGSPLRRPQNGAKMPYVLPLPYIQKNHPFYPENRNIKMPALPEPIFLKLAKAGGVHTVHDTRAFGRVNDWVNNSSQIE